MKWTSEHGLDRSVWVGMAVVASLLVMGVPRPERILRAQVVIERQDELKSLLTNGFDVVGWVDDGAPGQLEVLVPSGELSLLRRLAGPVHIVESAPDRAPVFKSAAAGGPPNFGSGSMGGYYTFQEVVALLDHYTATYPTIVGPKVSIGSSVEGRPIWAIKISDNPGISEAEPRVLIDSLHHSREPTSMQSALYLLDHLATGYGVDAEITDLVDAREVWFVPVVNPDGYVFNETTHPNGGGLWRKNRRVHAGGCTGVDLNRNYPFQWGLDDLGSSPDPCKESYRGSAPLSEPESAALEAFAAQQGFSTVCSLHAHGRQILYPFGYSPQKPPPTEGYEEHAVDFADPTGYLAGSIQEVLQLPANGNAVDHHHAVHGARAWTIEVGGEFWPSASEMIEVAERNQETLLRMIRYAGSFVVPTRIDPVELLGDGDGFLDPGETFGLHVDLRTRGIAATGTGISATIQSSDPNLLIQHASATVGPLAPFASASLSPAAQNPLVFSIAAGAPPGARATLTLHLQWDGIHTTRSIELDLGTPRTILRDDVEADLGWSMSSPGDDAFTGRWVLDDPDLVMQDGQAAQPDHDWTSGAGKRCFVTGNGGSAPGEDDVDDGTTTLTSPRLDLSSSVEPRIRYQRYYWCSKVDDPFRIEISSDDGQSWIALETVLGRRNEWTERTWRVEDVVPKTNQVRLRFVATDPTNNSVTEALIDQLEVMDFGSAPHVGLMGTPKLAGQVELQVVGAGGAAWILAAPALASAPVAIPGASGALGLDPSTMVLLAPITTTAGGLLRLPATLPAAPTGGVSVHLQVIQMAPLSFSGITTVDLP